MLLYKHVHIRFMFKISVQHEEEMERKAKEEEERKKKEAEERQKRIDRGLETESEQGDEGTTNCYVQNQNREMRVLVIPVI